MKQYRYYFLTVENNIVGKAEFESSDDQAAVEHARELSKRQTACPGFELWEGKRWVHRELP